MPREFEILERKVDDEVELLGEVVDENADSGVAGERMRFCCRREGRDLLDCIDEVEDTEEIEEMDAAVGG